MSLEEMITIVVYDYLWGLPLIVVVLLGGLYFTFRTGFFQFRYLGAALKTAWRRITGKEVDQNEGTGIVSPLEAVSIAIGTTVGVGNIGGVATAIALGGPGAVFWMWVAGLFGLIVKMVEITLALHYRSTDKNNENYGGPNYYIHKGIGVEGKHKWLSKLLGGLFAFGFLISIFINIQTYTASEAVANTFNISMVAVSIVYTIVLYIFIAGGLKRIARIASILVPFMCIFYVAGGLFIIFKNIGELPHSFGLIFGSAFTGTAAMGGFVGAGFKLAIKSGMSRSVFSNEAGWGSAPMTHASAKVNHPMKQGILGIFEVFIDTLVICTITALIVIITGQWSSGLDGATLTLSAFESGMGSVGRIILAVGVFLFAITTSTGLYVQISVVLRYVLGESKLKNTLLTVYKWFYPIPSIGLVFLAAYYEMPGTSVWLLSDASTALPIFANMVALVYLSPRFFALLKDFKARYWGIGKVDPGFKVFYEGSNEANHVDEVQPVNPA